MPKIFSTQRLEPLFILEQKLTEETEWAWFTQNTSYLLKILSIHRFIHTHHVFIRLRKFPNQVFENFWSDYHWRLQPEGKFSIRKRGKQQNQSWHMMMGLGSNQTKSHQYTNVQTRTEKSTAHDFIFAVFKMQTSEKLCLQWNDFQSNVKSAFADLINDRILLMSPWRVRMVNIRFLLTR